MSHRVCATLAPGCAAEGRSVEEVATQLPSGLSSQRMYAIMDSSAAATSLVRDVLQPKQKMGATLTQHLLPLLYDALCSTAVHRS